MRMNGFSMPAAAAAAAGVTTVFASVSTWPAAATTIVAAAGVLITGLLGLVATVDHYWMRRRKEWEEANKESLSTQLKDSLDNQGKMRESLHAIRNEAQRAAGEYEQLRNQFTEISKRLFETDVALNDANRQLRETLKLLAESKTDREAIRTELERSRAQAATNETRLTKLENPSAN